MQIFVQLLVLVASYFLSAILTPKPQVNNNKPVAATEDDWKMPNPEEGTPQCVFFGDCWTEDWFVLAYGNYRYSEIKKG